MKDYYANKEFESYVRDIAEKKGIPFKQALNQELDAINQERDDLLEYQKSRKANNK